MTTLYLSPRYTDDSQLLWRGAIKMGWDVLRLSWALMDHLAPSEVKERVIYGETMFTSMAADRLNVKLFEPPANFLYKMDKSLTNRRILNFTYSLGSGFWPCADLTSSLDYSRNIDWYDLKGPLFVKPVEKGLFEAKVYDNPVAQIKNLPEGTQVIVSEPVEWDIEFRSFVSGRKVRTISPYSRKGELVTQALAKEWGEAEAFANSVAKLYDFPCVIDVGYIVGKGWSVVEANGAWGSGLYGCDYIEALKVIKEACQCL